MNNVIKKKFLKLHFVSNVAERVNTDVFASYVSCYFVVAM